MCVALSAPLFRRRPRTHLPDPLTRTSAPPRQDDGSLWFNTHDSCHVYGHQKFKVGAIRNYDNVLAYVSDLAGSWDGVGASGYETNAAFGNRVVFASAGAVYHDCSWVGALAHDNALYGTPTIHGKGCPRDYTLAAWQALSPDNDVGSTVNATMPAPGEIMGWCREKLGM